MDSLSKKAEGLEIGLPEWVCEFARQIYSGEIMPRKAKPKFDKDQFDKDWDDFFNNENEQDNETDQEIRDFWK